MLEFCPTSLCNPTPDAHSSPDCLLIVRSTLEISALMKKLHPASQSALCEIEVEVRRAGQLLLDAGSVARARTALEALHRARLKLQQFDYGQKRFTA